MRRPIVCPATFRPQFQQPASTGRGRDLRAGRRFRIVDLAEDLEARAGVPVTGADVAMYWRAFQHLGIAPREKGHGQLLDSLG